jgi:hypothetical protein
MDTNNTAAKTAAPKSKPRRTKKAAKAAPKKKAASKKRAAPTKRAAPANGDAVIKIVTKENPRREGSEQHRRYAKLLRWGNKKVADYLESGGDRDCLSYAVKQGHAQLTGGRS